MFRIESKPLDDQDQSSQFLCRLNAIIQFEFFMFTDSTLAQLSTKHMSKLDDLFELVGLFVIYLRCVRRNRQIL